MNKERLLYLADVIEANEATEGVPERHTDACLYTFDMRWYKYETHCGTAMCIGGWAVHIWKEEVWPCNDIEENARKILGLSFMESQQLFSAINTRKFLGEITRKEAVATLRRAAKTGEITWE